jgi:large subunit ribosomal protein L6
MSRIGRQIISIPSGVTVNLTDRLVAVKGPKGELQLQLPVGFKAQVKEDQMTLSPAAHSSDTSLHGLYRSLLNNLVVGVSQGFSKDLKLVGTGYRARLDGSKLNLAVGFSHPVIIEPPAGITFSVTEDSIKVSGVDRSLVGQITANIRAVRPPEPYKGKGIRYRDELVRRKAGKQVKGAA